MRKTSPEHRQTKTRRRSSLCMYRPNHRYKPNFDCHVDPGCADSNDPGFRDAVKAGSLIFYGPNIPDLFRRAASFVDKILRGAKPGDIPVEQPTKFDLVINLTTAKALDLRVPDKLLALADEVIE
jgi:ABC transporter substrate binding protein